jgi:hypothetical protein
VTFEAAGAASFSGSGYDLAATFDCLHDMGDPLGAATHIRQALKPECATIRCPAGHHFNAPIEFLTWNGKGQGDPGATTADSRSVRDSQGSREGSTRSGHKPSPTADNPPYLGTPTPVTSSPSADVPNSSMRASASMWV